MKSGIHSWKNLVRFVWYFFSIPQLLGSLLTPWKADEFSSESSSAIERIVQNIIFAIFSRLIGLVIRLVTIVIGIILLVLSMVLFPLFAVVPIRLSYERMVTVGSVGKSWSFPMTSFLDKHGRDLRFAEECYLPPSREKVVQEVERILVRDTQHAVLLVAQDGVGKTAFLEQLAKRVHWGLIDPRLDFKRVVELLPDEMSLDQITRAIQQAEHAKNIILVIEHIHRYTDVLPIIMPYVASKKLRIILTTTFEAYLNQYKNNTELARVVEKVDLVQPTDQETVDILVEHVQKASYGYDAATHGVVLQELVKLTNQFMVRAPQPIKSLGILDKIIASKMPLDSATVQELIAEKTNVPLGALQSNEKNILLALESSMQEKIVGQRAAIHEVAEALKRSRSGIGNPNRPIGAFLFLGPTGVGKTYTAQVLAELYFGDKEAMIRFDMSEYRELDTLKRFIKRATTSIEEMPFSLFFIDEIEKAHPDILNLFLQIFDEGRLTGGDGVTVSFDNAIIICTSNAGSAKIQENLSITQKELTDHLIEQGMFRPEFLNRFDAITMFAPLSKEEVLAVTRLMLESLNKRIEKEKNIRIDITPELVERVADAGFDPQFGARPIRRAMQDLVENQLADKILRGEISEGSQVSIRL